VGLVDSKTELIMSISIPLRDFTPSSLVCLATSLKERYRDRTSILVSVFSSHEAASISIGALPPEHDRADVNMLAQMHGRYVFSAERHEDYVELMPVLTWEWHMDKGPFDTRIDLPVVAAPRCRVEIQERCLIASSGIDYPYEALKRGASGTVTLTGNVTRGGKVSDVLVMKAESVPEGERDLLANAAVRNLLSWRLAPGHSQGAIQITYSYVIDRGLPWNVQTQPRWVSPNEVVVKGRPPG
jgi:TonB family protein